MQKGSDNQDIWMRLLKLVPTSWVAFTEQCNAVPVELWAHLPCERAKVAPQGFLSKHDLIISKAFVGHRVSLVFTLVSCVHGHLEGYCPETFESHFLTPGGFCERQPYKYGQHQGSSRKLPGLPQTACSFSPCLYH